MKASEGDRELNDGGPDEAGIEDLLRQVGSRAEPPAEMMREIRAAAHAEWQVTVQTRRERQRWLRWGMAASVAIALSIVALSARFLLAEPTPMATVVRIDGRLLSATASDAWRARAVGDSVLAGETLLAADRSRAVVSFEPGVSLRLDHNTMLKVVSKDRVVLTSGALYVDSQSEIAPRAALTVQAHAGSVRHIGTQYEVRTDADGMEVSVREGRVMIASGTGENSAQAGERIRLTLAGEITRTALSPWHSDWQWAAAAAPSFDIDNRTLASFLEWVARETGRRLVYASAAAEAAAKQVKLRGSIVGLAPDQALDAVLATTQLQRFQTRAGLIGITLAEEKATPAAYPPNL